MPGFILTHKGRPTTQCYVGTTFFFDRFSYFTYIHLMDKLGGESTIKAKHTFERICKSHSVTVQHYHSNNGLFDTNIFKDKVYTDEQTLSFCGVNAHHQNIKAENRIKDFTTGARTSLLHAAHRWPEAIHTVLWPAALKNYTNIRNSLPTEFKPGERIGNNQLPDTYNSLLMSKFSRTKIEANLNRFHPFGSPVYVLKKKLQQQKSHIKWSGRSRVGIFICHSPFHASDVTLVLNTQMGNVSPQFHYIYDDDFATCKRDARFTSLWQHKENFNLNHK